MMNKYAKLKEYYVYMMATRRNGTIYVGFSGDLTTRVRAHKSGNGAVFTGKYKVDKLVYFEPHSSRRKALHREYLMKRWRRQWKIELIEKFNANWDDLAKDWD